MGDAATLITAIAGLVTAVGGLLGAAAAWRASSKRERPRAARNVLAELAEAAADGEITEDELRRIADGEGRGEP